MGNWLQIALRSVANGSYVKVNHDEGTAVAKGHHPILYVSDNSFCPQASKFGKLRSGKPQAGNFEWVDGAGKFRAG